MSASAVLTPAERDSLVRFRPAQAEGHVESLFLKLNLPQGEARALWLKVTLLKRLVGRRDTVAEAWAIAFNLGAGEGSHVAIKRTWPFEEARIDEGRFRIRLGDVELGQGRAKGALVDERTGDAISWDLVFTTEAEGFRHMPYGWMYEGNVPKTKALSPQIDSRVSGTVTVQGKKTEIRDAPGMLGHNWGRQQGEAWTWVHCNLWSGVDGVVFEGLSARAKFGRVTSPLLTILHARIPGERITVNGVVQLFASRSRPDGLSWRFSGEQAGRRIVGSFGAPPERFVGVDYHDPDGRIAHCLNTKIADGEITILAREGRRWREISRAVADRSAALEIGTRGPTHGVPIRIR